MKPVTVSLAFKYTPSDKERLTMNQQEFNDYCLGLAVETIGNAYMEDQLEYILKVEEYDG